MNHDSRLRVLKIKAAIFALAVAYSGSSPDRKVGTFFYEEEVITLKSDTRRYFTELLKEDTRNTEK